MIKNFLLVGVGGGMGSVARYIVQKWFLENTSQPFPWGTFIANITGCFLIGVIYWIAEKASVSSVQIRLLLMTGFCGGYTTFSSFAFENLTMLRSGEIFYFVTYSVLSIALGIASVFAGIALMKLW